MADTFITMDQVGYDRLKAEITRTQEVLEELLASRTREAGSNNTLEGIMENPILFDFDQKQRMIQKKLHTLQEKLKKAIVITPSAVPDVVGLGSIVTVQFLDETNMKMKFKLCSVSFDTGEDEYTTDSPIGKAIIGHRVDDIVTYTVCGNVIQVRIVAID